MKKVLFASTALVAATLMTATGASASEKIKLNLGGFSKWWVVGQFNDAGYTGATFDANQKAGRDFNTIDIKGDNEIYFGGSTTLDNGMKVGVQVELEAGGHTETSAAAGDVIDESYAFIESGMGKFIIGSENNGTYLLHVQAPDAAGNWGEGGIMTGGASLQKPDNVATITPGQAGGNTTAIVTDNDADKLTYVAPTFFGLTLGASYVPSTSEDNRGLVDLKTVTAGEIYGVGGLYANTFGGVGVKVSAGYVQYNVEATKAEAGVEEMAFGTQLSYAGFTLGGSYRDIGADRAVRTFEGNAWDLGLQYASGPFAVSLAYFTSSVEGSTAISGDDTITFYQLSGKYSLGAGVDALASLGYGDYDDESVQNTAGDSNHNDGYVVMTGMALAF